MDATEVSVSTGEVEQVVASAFETMMGLQVQPVNQPWCALPEHLIATVQFNGAKRGALVVEMESAQARKFAGCLLGNEPETVDDDVRDAVGELANVIGGNLKAMVAPTAALSIPCVVDGSDFKIRVCGSTRLDRRAFAADGSVFWISWVVTDACSHEDAVGVEISSSTT